MTKQYEVRKFKGSTLKNIQKKNKGKLDIQIVVKNQRIQLNRLIIEIMLNIINNEFKRMTQDKQVVQGMSRKFFEIIHKYIEKNFTKT